MKKSLFVFFIFMNFNCFSQSRLYVGNSEPDYYIDSVRVQALGVFDPNKIESINVVKDSTAPSGKIYIKIKKNTTVHFLTAKDIVVMNNIIPGSISIFLLDNEIVKDTSNFSIDSSYILKVEIVKASEIKYLPENISNLSIVKIITATQANIDKEKLIFFRGK